MSLRRLFTEHPASVGESYLGHLFMAGYFAMRMIAVGVACLVHAFLPFLFEKTASRTIEDLHERMVLHRNKAPAARTRRPFHQPVAR